MHQAPDVVHYADFVYHADDVCLDLSQRWRSWVPDGLDLLPYPNGPKMRSIAVARCPDLVLLRAAAGRIILTTDARLSDRVLSFRLLQAPPSWSFKDPRASNKRWRRAALQEIRADRWTTAAWRTDVANFFRSIDLQLLGRQLHDWRCDLDAIGVVMHALGGWTRVVPGLPIGPEISSVLGNAFLDPLDRHLQGLGASYYRYMDDVVVVGHQLDGDELAAPVDQILRELRLHRNESKTKLYEPGFAVDAVDDAVLSYVAAGAEHADPTRLLQILEAEAQVPYPDPKRVRFVLRGLGQDPAATTPLSVHPGLLNCDPLETCGYLALHPRSQTVRDSLIRAIGTTGEQHTALRLHAARAAAGCSWGRSEGTALLSVAANKDEHPLVRAHAWHAAARTPAWRATAAMEAGDAERHPALRRAIVLTLRRAAPSRSKQAFLRQMSKDPLVTYAARWAA